MHNWRSIAPQNYEYSCCHCLYNIDGVFTGCATVFYMTLYDHCVSCVIMSKSVMCNRVFTGGAVVFCYDRLSCCLQAIEALEAFPSSTSRDLLRESILNPQFYYKVRVQAAHSLAKVGTDSRALKFCSVCVFELLGISSLC